MKKFKKILLIIAFISLAMYTVFTIINQQQALNQYNKDKETILAQIKEENINKEELMTKKDNINSLDFIEQMAREKLDMYLPNEKVYVDQGM